RGPWLQQATFDRARALVMNTPDIGAQYSRSGSDYQRRSATGPRATNGNDAEVWISIRGGSESALMALQYRGARCWLDRPNRTGVHWCDVAHLSSATGF